MNNWEESNRAQRSPEVMQAFCELPWRPQTLEWDPSLAVYIRCAEQSFMQETRARKAAGLIPFNMNKNQIKIQPKWSRQLLKATTMKAKLAKPQ